jgi:hypothetical protein
MTQLAQNRSLDRRDEMILVLLATLVPMLTLAAISI